MEKTTAEKLHEATMRHSALVDEQIRNINERLEAAMLRALESMERSNKQMEECSRKRETEKRREQVFSLNNPQK